MKNYLKRGIHAMKDYFTFLSQSEIFDVSEKSSTFFGDEKISKYFIQENNCSRYIGKLFKEKNEREKRIYNDTFIILSLAYLFNHSWEGNKVVMKIGRNVSKFANGEEDIVHCMSLEEEKAYIMNLAKRYFPDRYKKLVLVDMEEDNPELFQTLQEKGIDGLDNLDRQPQLGENFTSLDIAKYLYWVCKKNPSFYALTKKLITEDQIKKTNDNYPHYYGLIEIACRIKDLLKGTTIQGGADRQNLYDDFIKTIVGERGNIDKFPELKVLQNFCKSHIGKKHTFERIYLYRKKYNQLLKENEEKVKHRSKYFKLMGGTALGLSLLLGGTVGGYYLSNQKQQQEQETKNKKYLDETLSDKHTKNVYFDARQGIHTAEGLAMRVNEATDAMYSDFLQIYGPGKETDEKTLIMIKNLMNQYFLVADSNGVLINLDAVYGPYLIPELLHKSLKEFIAKYGWFMIKSGFSLTPQPKMQEYTSACEYTQELEGNVIAYYQGGQSGNGLYVKSDSTKYQKEFDDFLSKLQKENRLDRNVSAPKHTFNSKEYREYLHNNGKRYDVIIVRGQDDKQFLLAYERQDGEVYFDNLQNHVYTKANGELVAKDFLENWKMVSE